MLSVGSTGNSLCPNRASSSESPHTAGLQIEEYDEQKIQSFCHYDYQFISILKRIKHITCGFMLAQAESPKSIINYSLKDITITVVNYQRESLSFGKSDEGDLKAYFDGKLLCRSDQFPDAIRLSSNTQENEKEMRGDFLLTIKKINQESFLMFGLDDASSWMETDIASITWNKKRSSWELSLLNTENSEDNDLLTSYLREICVPAYCAPFQANIQTNHKI